MNEDLLTKLAEVFAYLWFIEGVYTKYVMELKEKYGDEFSDLFYFSIGHQRDSILSLVEKDSVDAALSLDEKHNFVMDQLFKTYKNQEDLSSQIKLLITLAKDLQQYWEEIFDLATTSKFKSLESLSIKSINFYKEFLLTLSSTEN